MSVQISIDAISPRLDHLIRQAGNKEPILRAMGEQFLSTTQKAFDTPSLRIAEWVARKNTKFSQEQRDNSAAQRMRGSDKLVTSSGGKTWPLLKKSGLLVKSFRVEVGTSTVTIASDRPYASIHQFGGMAGKGHKTKIPARPFMPIDRDGQMPAWAQDKIVKVAQASAKEHFGIS